ncbi:MAG TPA: hypothetical protein VMJ30_01860 [Gemmatimonadales bacterium]|nr:hypothetical protein [Gemmatimonadales bacterium]
MQVRRLLSLALLAAVTQPALAQNSQCQSYLGNTQTYNVCNAAIDGTVLFTPAVGMIVSGGSPVIGTARNLGSFIHVSLALRGNATEVVTPSLNYDGTTTTVPQDQKLWVGTPNVDAAVGVYGGMNGGLLAIDILGSALLIPTNVIDKLGVDPNAPKIGSVALGLGYGVRVGVTHGHGAIPAISVSYMRRHLPRLSYGDVPGGDRYSYATQVDADNLRASAGYHFSPLEITGGLGWDHYKGNSDILFRDPVTDTQEPPINVDVKRDRTLAYLGAALNFGFFTLAGEAGWQFGKAETLATTFEGNDPGKTRFFVDGGLRFSF